MEGTIYLLVPGKPDESAVMEFGGDPLPVLQKGHYISVTKGSKKTTYEITRVELAFGVSSSFLSKKKVTDRHIYVEAERLYVENVEDY